MSDAARHKLLVEKIEQLYHDLASTGDIRAFAIAMIQLANDRTYSDAPYEVHAALFYIVPTTVVSPLIELACPHCGCEEFGIVNHVDDDDLSYRQHYQCNECGRYYWVDWYATKITADETPDGEEESIES